MMNQDNKVSLNIIKDLEDKIKSVRTRSLDLSFNELVDMYKDNELIITPDYQRLFRWSEANQSRFIESLLLEMPIPPIFVVEKEEGVYELIDGLQRISSYLHFRGELKNYNGSLISYLDDEPDLDIVDECTDEDLLTDITNQDTCEVKDNVVETQEDNILTLTGCDICPGLNGLTYETLPKTLVIRLKRSFIRVEVIRKESDPRLRYHMFKRLNTGGEMLSHQEIRNCTIRLLSPQFNDFIIKLSNNTDFQKCIENISSTKKMAKYDQELVLRYFAFKDNLDQYSHDINPFLTEYLEQVSLNESFDYNEAEELFSLTFKILASTLGEKSFSPVADKRVPHEIRKLARKFAIYHFEAIALCISFNIDKLKTILDKDSLLKKLEKTLTLAKTDDEFIKLTTGGGKNYSGPLKERLNFIDSKLKEFIEHERL
ncbi:DUF262 domain-containing protein [uncultured Veillonella sp.]|uniref:DUF262 domain-containing protein n=1 Tax=uncultured Veillonella sp. TaxID=159268 RepID=UPI0028E8E294|nr:DUF262 domain-containing protein [uncultured Veillonella sp.]